MQRTTFFAICTSSPARRGRFGPFALPGRPAFGADGGRDPHRGILRLFVRLAGNSFAERAVNVVVCICRVIGQKVLIKTAVAIEISMAMAVLSCF